MNAFNFLANPVMDALGWTLLHAIWQGFALVLPTAFILYLLRNQSSTLRYRVSVFTLLSQVLLSAATFIWYYRPVAIINSPLYVPTTITVSYTTHIKWQIVAQTLPWHQQVQQFLEAHLSQFVLVYLIGVVLFGLRLAGGWIFLQRLSQTATLPSTIVWAHMTDKLRVSLLLQTVVQVRESTRISVPMVVGILKPILLLPVGLVTHLTTREIEAVLAHELAHIKRHDYAVNLLQSVVEVLYFFHPALWWLSARVREEREHCCDDLAVQVCGGDGRILAQALARVEELRLVQTNHPPELAMAFASKRQQLLHRVRRMLGVPTRPFVSNSSLAGITLATLLLISVSVYAVQQEKPKSGNKQPRPSHSTRRHNKGSGTEYGVSDTKKVDYVIWKGQKLPAKRIARLQTLLDEVMAGKLSLDNVAQTDRDILLTIIETNQSFGSGMNALSEGLAQIDYSNIVASALATVRPALDAAADGLANVNSKNGLQEATDTIPDNGSSDSFSSTTVYDLVRRQDSLLNMQALNQSKIASLKAKAQSQRFAVESVERSIERLERQKSVLEQRRFSQTMKQQQAILQSGFAKTDSAQTAISKQIETGEATIRKTESEIDAMNRQIVNIHDELEKAQKPLYETESELRELGHLSYGWGTTIGPSSNVPGPGGTVGAPVHSLRAINRLSPIKSAKPATAPHPSTPAVPSAPNAKAIPSAPPVQMAKPSALPKPALAPKAEKLQKSQKD